MRDYLLDLVEHTYDLGYIDLIKVVGTDKETAITGCSEKKTVIVDGKFHKPVPEFIGTFGMPNLGKLKIILNLPEYKEGATITNTVENNNNVDGIEFSNTAGDFKNNYRYMEAALVNNILKAMKFNAPTWHVEFEPTIAGIQRFKMQAQANAEETSFTAKTDNGNLKFYFGDHSTHAGNFVFQPGVSGSIKRAWSWPVKELISILDLNGDKKFKLSDDGAAMIEVDSGLAIYRYIIPALTK